MYPSAPRQTRVAGRILPLTDSTTSLAMN